MQVHPTRASVDLAVAAIGTILVGLLLQLGPVVAFGGSLLAGLAIARAVTRVGIARIRAAGFEMLWRGDEREVTAARGDVVELEAEIRNRDTRAARYVELRAVASPNLIVTLDPPSGEVPALGRLNVTVRVQTPRVGRHGIHGLSLEVQGSPGLFEVPLTFANPFGIEVMPQSFGSTQRSARGGRSRRVARDGLAGPLSGDGTDLRELRELRPGDPFKRIAWKATARRGKLMVRDFEREERDVVWLLLDASVELWAGTPGQAPLDRAIDEVARVAHYFTRRGDQVGLGILAARNLAWISPQRGPAQLNRIQTALALQTATIDADRSDWDEGDAAARALEHMRPLDPVGTHQLRSRDVERIARRADRLRARAPFKRADPFSRTPRDKSLRRYLSLFGIGSPARLEPERTLTDIQLLEALRRARTEGPRASLIYVWSEPPDPLTRPNMAQALAKHKSARTAIRWVSMRTAESVTESASVMSDVANDAVKLRAQLAQERGERELRRLGIRVERFFVRQNVGAGDVASTLP
ncbi:MAG: DUF58 domain-containing protein [Polyangiaceae bacterium]|nr:DUF58 domain-containing protein [Polyangiaceae bacterium]